MKEVILIAACVFVVATCNGLKKERVIQIQHHIGEAITITEDAE